MLLSEHKKICLKQKDWSKRGGTATSPDHLSRQFLTTASTFPHSSKIPQPNIFTHTNTITHTDKHTHTLSQTLTQSLTHTHIHTHTHTRTHTLSLSLSLSLSYTYTGICIKSVNMLGWGILELYGKVEAATRNCLLRLSGHLVEVAGTPSPFRSVFF